MNSDDEEIGHLRHAAMKRQRRYADFFGWPDRPVMERAVVADLFAALQRDTRISFSELRSREPGHDPGHDPPDCEATDSAGELVAIEVTELVDTGAIHEARKRNPYHWAEWSRDRLAEAVRHLVVRKGRALLQGGPYARPSLPTTMRQLSYPTLLWGGGRWISMMGERMKGERGLLAAAEPAEERSDEAGSAAAAPPPDPEVEARPKRRRFTAAYRLGILGEADRCQKPGEIGQLLRREGLYSSHLASWRKSRREGSLAALAPKRGGAKPKARSPLEPKVRQLEAQVKRLEAELEKAHTILDVQEKVAGLLGFSLESGKDS